MAIRVAAKDITRLVMTKVTPKSHAIAAVRAATKCITLLWQTILPQVIYRRRYELPLMYNPIVATIVATKRLLSVATFITSTLWNFFCGGLRRSSQKTFSYGSTRRSSRHES